VKAILLFCLLFISTIFYSCSSSNIVEVDSSNLSPTIKMFYNNFKYYSTFITPLGEWEKEFSEAEVFKLAKLYEKTICEDKKGYLSLSTTLNKAYFDEVQRANEKDEIVYKIEPRKLRHCLTNLIINNYCKATNGLIRTPHLLRVKLLQKSTETRNIVNSNMKSSLKKMTVLVEDVLKSKDINNGDTLKIFYPLNADVSEDNFKINSSYFLGLFYYSLDLEAYHLEFLNNSVIPIENDIIYFPKYDYGLGKNLKWTEFRKLFKEKFLIFNTYLYK